MHDATVAMKTLTQHMADKMDHLSDKTDHMADKMDHLSDKTDHMSDGMDHLSGQTDVMVGKMGDLYTLTQSLDAKTSQLLEKMKHMSETTEQLLGLTKQMRDTTKSLVGLTINLTNLFKVGFKNLTMAVANDGRRNAFYAMDTKTDFLAKFSDAGKYFYSMEYQFWDPRVHTLDDRLIMFKNMTMEFTSEIHDFATDFTNYSLTIPMMLNDMFEYHPFSSKLVPKIFGLSDAAKKSAARRNDLFALAGTAHLMLDIQKDSIRLVNKSLPKDKRLVPESMLSLIEEGLTTAYELKNPSSKTKSLDQVPDYQHNIMDAQPQMIWFLQIRQLFIRGVVLCRSAGSLNGNLEPDMAMGWQYLQSKIGKSQWTPTLVDQNAAQIDVSAQGLEFMAESMQFLKSIGEKPQAPDDIIATLWKHMDLSLFYSKVNSYSPAKRAAVNRFKTAMDKVAALDAQNK